MEKTKTMANTKDIEITERQFLSGILGSDMVYHEASPFITDKHFKSDVHKNIYNAIEYILSKGEDLNRVTLSQNLRNLGIKGRDDLSITEYIELMDGENVSEKAAMNLAKDLIKQNILEGYEAMGSEIIKTSRNPKIKTGTIDQIISYMDSLYTDKVDINLFEEKAVDFFDDLEACIEEKGNNPVEEIGLETPYANFNRMFGGVRKGNLHAVVARPGNGKSTWLNDLGVHTARINNCKSFGIDTEMTTREMQDRTVSALSGVPLWYIETGNWRKDAEMTRLVRQALSNSKSLKGLYHHQFVGNKDVNGIISLAKRWYYKEVGRGNDALITYDYIKLTNDKIGNNWAEHQAMGDKIDRLKNLGKNLDIPVFVAMQMNRSADNFNKKTGDFADDSSAIALTDRLQWFASFVGIFRKKTLDEIEAEGEEFGTHKLVPIKTRFQGRDAAGHNDFIRTTDEDGNTKYRRNFITFNVENFAVNEVGTLQDIVNAQNLQAGQDGSGNSNQGAGDSLF